MYPDKYIKIALENLDFQYKMLLRLPEERRYISNDFLVYNSSCCFWCGAYMGKWMELLRYKGVDGSYPFCLEVPDLREGGAMISPQLSHIILPIRQ